MNRFKNVLACAALASLSASCFAGDNGTVYTQLGINGLGIGYSKSINDDWALRGQYNYLPSQNFTGSSGDYGTGANVNVSLQWNSLELLADWYMGDGFHLTGGIVGNSSKITADATNATIGTQTGATAHAEIKLSDTIAPYLGIGYLSKPKDAKGFGFNYDLGVMFLHPTVSLTSPTPGVSASDIATQTAKVQDAINQLQTFPVFAIGFGYSF